MRTKILSQKEPIVKENLIEVVRSHPLFKDWKKALETLSEGGKIEKRTPHYLLWETQADDCPFALILGGLVAVNYHQERQKHEHINGFLLKGQLIGDFELLKVDRSSTRLTTLSETTLFIPRPEVVRELNNPKNSHLLNTTIARGLVSKIYHKNEIIELLQHNLVIDRMIFLLSSFRSKDNWSYLLKNPSADQNSYEIDVFWSDTNLTSLLSTEFRKVRESLADLVGARIIQAELYEKTNGEMKLIDTISYEYINSGKLCKKRKNTFIKIKVLDKSELDSFKKKE